MVSQSYVLRSLPEVADHHFRHWKAAFEDLTGIQLGVERESLVKSILQARLLEKGVNCFENYLQQLLASPSFGRIEWDVLFSRILIGETRFFRHQPTFDFVGQYLKELLRNRPVEDRTLRLWSMGCSSGEEAYSLAIQSYRICRGAGEEGAFEVIGSDINTEGLKLARQGDYRNISRRGIDESTATAFFENRGNGIHSVRQFLRKGVKFVHHNLLEPLNSELFQKQDIISCQNVLIYFQDWRRRAVIRQVVQVLRPGGVLVVGAGELLGWKPEGLERLQVKNVQAYRRVI